jgi:hypothetical protein
VRTAVLALLIGCVQGSGDEVERGVTGDASAIVDTATTIDTGSAMDSVAVDTFVPVVDTGAEAAPDTAACKTDCKGIECGPIPDGCGGIKDCGDCMGAPGEYCVVLTPLHQMAVRQAIETTKTTHPEYFDFTDTLGGESVKVKDPTGFRTSVVSEVNMKMGKVCIPDPNDSREVRVRASTSMSAENYLTITSGGYSAYKYTSTCTPAGF